MVGSFHFYGSFTRFCDSERDAGGLVVVKAQNKDYAVVTQERKLKTILSSKILKNTKILRKYMKSNDVIVFDNLRKAFNFSWLDM